MHTVSTSLLRFNDAGAILKQIETNGLLHTLDGISDVDVLALTARYCAHNYDPLPVVIRRAEGARVWDESDKEYIDLIGSYSAVSHGHRNKAIISAVREQCDRVTLASRAVNSPELALFVSALCEYCDQDMAIPMNTGAEAVETAIKIARKWAYTVKKIPKNRAEIIVADGNFHGRTTTIIGFSSEPQYKDSFGPFGPGFISVPFDNIEAVRSAITPNTAAVLMEPIQAEAGIIIPRAGFLSELRRVCTENNILLIWDEIQTGFCRTGRRFAWQWEPEAIPDLMTLGKALGGGIYPVSAVVGSRTVMGVLEPGDHGSTFGGNPLACAVGLTSLVELNRCRLDERAQELGERFRAVLIAMNDHIIADIRGKGLLTGIEIGRSFGTATAMLPAFLEQGILTKDTHSQTLRFAPPLTITEKELESALERITRVFGSFHRSADEQAVSSTVPLPHPADVR